MLQYNACMGKHALPAEGNLRKGMVARLARTGFPTLLVMPYQNRYLGTVFIAVVMYTCRRLW
jgi:hypothetical protein